MDFWILQFLPTFAANLTVARVAIGDDADEAGDVVVVEGGEEPALARKVILGRLARPSF